MKKLKDISAPKKNKGMSLLQNVFSIALFLLLWEVLVRAFHVREAFLCTPSSALYHLLWPQPDADYHWQINILMTLKEYVISFGIVVVGSIALSVLIVWSKRIQDLLMPVFIFINSMPMVAVAPLLLIWIGYGLKTNVLIAFLVSFFPMVINTITGLNAQDPNLLDLVRYLGANRWQLLFKIQIPGALPYIFSGMKVSSSLCIMGVIVGELIASDRGLGYVIVNAQLTMDTPPMFASIIMIPYGDTLEFGSYPGTVHIPQTVLEEYLYAVANSLLIHSGFRAVVFLATHSLNCHAANSVCRRLTIEGKKVLLADWWAAVGSRSCGVLEDTATGRGHGSEMITSVAFVLCKELVRMEDALAETPAPALEKVNRWNGTPFKTYGCFRQYCKSGAWGNMSLATAEKGRLLLQRGVEAVSQFIMEALAQ